MNDRNDMERQTRLLPCGHKLHSYTTPGPRAHEVHAYRLDKDASRHSCRLVSHTNPGGFADKRAGE